MSHNTLPPSSIDFLTSCSTGVDLISGYASVHYWVYSAEAIPQPPHAPDAKDLDNALFEALIAIREKKHIVYHDEGRNALWFFAGTAYTPGLYPPELSDGNTGIERHGFKFKIIFSGMFRPAELNIHPARLAAMQSANHAPTPTGTSSTTANARAFQHNASGGASAPVSIGPAQTIDRHDVRSIFGHFIKAFQTSFAFTLAREQKALPLDSRSYVVYPNRLSGLLQENESTTPLTVFTIDHALANGGGLLVSTNVSETLAMYSNLDLLPYRDAAISALISPGGAAVEIVADAGRHDAADILQWKSLVKKQIRGRGIDLNALDSQDRWLLVKSQPSLIKTGDDSENGTVFYWPAALCFTTQAPIEIPVAEVSDLAVRPHLNEHAGLSWFLPSGEGGNHEPVGFAQEWYDGKEPRDRTIFDRRKQAELEKKQAESAAQAATSPSYPRDGLQATAGVYPTPPDAVPHANLAPGVPDGQNLALPTDQGAHRSSLDMQHSEMMDLDLDTFEENPRQRPSVISRSSLDGGVKVVGDDLFGDDMVDEDLRGQDITDADFSFFDEPADDLMLDDIPEDAAEEETKAEHAMETSAIAAPSASVDDQSPKAQPVDTGDPSRLSTSGLFNSPGFQANGPQLETSDTPMSDVDKVQDNSNIVEEPLSPSAVRKRLFDFAITSTDKQRRPSQFQPLAFNAVVQQNDAKYTMQGAFAFKLPNTRVAESQSPTSPFIKPRPPDTQGRRTSLHPPKSLTCPERMQLLESDSSSDDSDSSEVDSVYGAGTRSIVSSSTRARFQDGVSVEDALSIAGTNAAVLEYFNIDLKVRELA